MFVIEKKEYMTEDTESRSPKIIGVMLEWERSLPTMTRVQYILKIESVTEAFYIVSFEI